MTRSDAERPLRDLIDHARRAVGYQDHTPAGADEPTFRRSKPAAVPAGLDLRVAPVDAALRGVAVDAENMSRTDLRALGVSGGSGTAAYGDGSAAGDFAADGRHAFDLLTTRPAVARAGAVIRDFPAERGRIFGVERATFAAVTDDAPAPDAGVEFAEAGGWDLGDDSSVTTYGCTIRATRALEKLVGRDTLEQLLFGALSAGAARAVDAATLDAITGATGTITGTPALADFAAAGVTDPAVLRAVLGAEANAAALDPATGRAHVSGFEVAGMTDALSTQHAVIGDWSSVVVLVEPEMRLIAHRLDAQGSLEITSFLDVKPVLLDPARLAVIDGAA
jgi:hypothetical protein